MVKTLVNCSICGTLFKTEEGSICSKCLDDKEGPYQKVREYIFFNHRASIYQVSKATGVKPRLILKYIRDGSITTKDK